MILIKFDGCPRQKNGSGQSGSNNRDKVIFSFPIEPWTSDSISRSVRSPGLEISNLVENGEGSGRHNGLQDDSVSLDEEQTYRVSLFGFLKITLQAHST
jgi:hypothetical protein